MKSLKEQPMKASKALVFDIKRFAVHDGHGLRTTVFIVGVANDLMNRLNIMIALTLKRIKMILRMLLKRVLVVRFNMIVKNTI